MAGTFVRARCRLSNPFDSQASLDTKQVNCLKQDGTNPF